MWHVKIQEDALEFLKRLDQKTRTSFIARLEKLSFLPDRQGKPLTGPLKGFRRLRIGRYRVIYHLDWKERIVTVIAIGHRKEIYKRSF